MASRASIEFDFETALTQADIIDAAADRLSGISDRTLPGTLESVRLNWLGESAALFLLKGERLRDKMEISVEELHSIAEAVRKIAKRVFEAEMRNLEIAETNTD